MEILYTEEMAAQDKLWNEEKEILPLMNALQWQVITKFLQGGNKKNLHFNVYVDGNESIVDVYTDKNIEKDGQINNAISCGNCKSLIETIKQLAK